MKKTQRGLALITALAIVALFLALAIMMLELATHNGQNVGAGYTKQQYFDVAEAGIDRGLTDIDSNLPAPGPTSFSGSPPSPPPAPSGDQTALPSIPGVVYHYSYWHNPSASPTSTPDPLNVQGFGGPASTVTVPGYGTLVWSYTKGTGRDVGVEAVATVFTSMHSTCAMCAGGNITVGGSTNGTAPGACQDYSMNMKICTDPSPSPNPVPSSVPIVTGGTYSSTSCSGAPCAYGDGAVSPQNIQQNASTGFLDPQSTIDELSNAKMWQTLSSTDSNVFYVNCSGGCSGSTVSNLNNKNGLAVGQTAFLDGNLAMSGKESAQYNGLMIVNGCMSMSGNATLNGGPTASQLSPGETIVLGTDAQCGGYAFGISGNAYWQGGTLYTAQGSAQIAGQGKTKFVIFYGNVISAGGINITGNGTFAYEYQAQSQTAFIGQYAVDSFMQY